MSGLTSKNALSALFIAEEPMIKQNLHLEIIRCFISNAEVDVNTQGINGKTALHYAIESDDLALVDLLFNKKNVNPFIKDDTGKAPLDYAQEESKTRVLQALIDRKYGPDGDSLLHLAAAIGEVKAVRYLIEKGVDVNLRNALHHTPLHLAAGAGHKNIVEILVKEGGAEIDVFDARNQTPLHYAVNNKRLKTVELLIKLKANVNAVSVGQSSTGLSPLHIAVSNSSYDERDLCLDVVKCLISTPECRVNPQDHENQTPLHYAVDGDGLSTTDVLLSRKDIDPLMKDDNGKTPFEYAVEENKQEIVKVLRENRYGVDHNHLLHLAAQKGYTEIIDIITRMGEDINVLNNKNQSPIYFAAEQGCLNAIELLLKKGASPAVALHCAIRTNNLELLKVLLIRKDADLFGRDNEGKTPIDYAEENPVMFHMLSKCAEVIEKRNSHNKKVKLCTVLTLAVIGSMTVVLTIAVGMYTTIAGVFTAVTIVALSQLMQRSIDNNCQQKVLKVLSETETTKEPATLVDDDERENPWQSNNLVLMR
ncbi:MAG: hypothetical protein sL5_09020 [Candidatus Mesenet longicola]|uniref:Ankyrin repeat domain-containing protein n=1 Tax=Candidatus Mesenet longicola TaxID=1892558 RepID=A0A8J3HVS7_9RICK|nr:MAG: hypothetical protein sGL2_07000 [Candidatus Mesenet longicola]GHM59909.1 MAG: hypothetical protein sL5_09020 [Candidatus Mesenet longicola]